MKLAPWITAVAVAAISAICGLAACAVNHRSSDFACQTQNDCRDGRICLDNLCVRSNDVPPDAPQFPDASVCPSQCTSCNTAQKTCTIDCPGSGDCDSLVLCPNGWSCNVLCGGQNSCSNGVSCFGATSCTVTCSGRQSCKTVSCGLGNCKIGCTGPGSCGNSVVCGPGMCGVDCTGLNSCNGDLSCGTSCACDVSCRVGTCSKLTCRLGCDADTPPGCSSMASGCNTCK